MAEFPVPGFWDGTVGPVSEVVATGGDSRMLAALALAYSNARTKVSAATERALVDLWLRMLPITDADLVLWLSRAEAILAGAQTHAIGLALAYQRRQLAALGVDMGLLPSRRPEPVHGSAAKWLESNGQAVPEQARRVESALASTDPTVADVLHADRVTTLTRPVVKVRVEAPVKGLRQAVSDAATEVVSGADESLRAAERATVSGIRWPTFKNGVPMLYARAVQGGACGWCVIVATRLYSAASARANTQWHSGCRCSWRAVSESEAKAYAKGLGRDGDYYGAAKAVGLWDGSTDVNYAKYIKENRFDPAVAQRAGYVSRRWDEAAGGYKVYDSGSGGYVPVTKRGSE